METRAQGCWSANRAMGLLVLLAAVCSVGVCTVVFAQQQNQGGVAAIQTRAVGGVLVDPQGMLLEASQTQLQADVEQVLQRVQATDPAVNQAVPLRKVSLKGIIETIAQYTAEGKPLPGEVLCLAGLQDIRYIVADPEAHDIILVGPAEGWVVGRQGVLVGETSADPVLLLEDLVAALQAVTSPRPEVISCSIDPTQEGLARYQRFAARISRGASPVAVARQIEQLLGPQQITVTGVPAGTHYARVLVAADYQMKRIGLGMEHSGLPELPSYLDLVRSTRAVNPMPRWWLAPDTADLTLKRDPQGLVWEISGLRVKTMAESDILAGSQVQRGAGRKDPLVSQWADLMTKNYDQLAKVRPVFAQVRDCMNLAVAAAVITSYRLPERVGLDIGPLVQLDTARQPAPQYVASKAVAVRRTGGWIIACGGVQINPWEIAKAASSDQNLSSKYEQLRLAQQECWWSN